MRKTWGVMAGLGMAGLLVAAAPAQAQSGTSSPSAGSASGTSDSSSYGQPGSKSGSATTGDTGTSGSATTQSPGATGTDTTTGSMASATSGQNEVTGKVEKFDKSKKELSLRLKISDSAQVMKDGKTASLSDLKPGDEVRASFSGTGDTLEVNRIDVLSGSSKGSKESGSSSSPSGMGSSGSSSSPSGSSSSGSSSSGSGSSSSGRGY